MEKSIVFSTLTSNLIPAILQDVDFKYNDNLLRRLRLTIKVDYRTYELICRNGYFHLLKANKLADYSFTPEKQVYITLKPSEELHKSFCAIQDRVVIQNRILSEDDSILSARKEMNWFAATVSQEADLPADMAETGMILEGFTTEYDDVDEDEEDAEIKEASDYLKEWMDESKDIENVLNKYDIPFSRDEDGFSGNVTFTDKKWSIFVYETKRIFIINSSYPFFAEEQAYDKLSRELVKINALLLTGNFDLDLEEGVISLPNIF